MPFIIRSVLQFCPLAHVKLHFVWQTEGCAERCTTQRLHNPIQHLPKVPKLPVVLIKSALQLSTRNASRLHRSHLAAHCLSIHHAVKSHRTVPVQCANFPEHPSWSHAYSATIGCHARQCLPAKSQSSKCFLHSQDQPSPVAVPFKLHDQRLLQNIKGSISASNKYRQLRMSVTSSLCYTATA